jgi:putative Mg2+ transporter-C (MgtC) family protein
MPPTVLAPSVRLPAFDEAAFVVALYELGVAFIIGAVIGLERQFRQRSAGLRTMVLVSVGAAAFVHLGARIYGAAGQAEIIAYVVSGIGFLCAGVIINEGLQVRGLNTAATLWATAAAGACAGAGFLAEAVAVTLFVIAGNTLLRPLVDFINRQPMTSGQTEALYRVHVTCDPSDVSTARELLFETLSDSHYPVQDIDTLSESEDIVELAASLVPTSADTAELEAITNRLEKMAPIKSASWTVSALS